MEPFTRLSGFGALRSPVNLPLTQEKDSNEPIHNPTIAVTRNHSWKLKLGAPERVLQTACRYDDQENNATSQNARENSPMLKIEPIVLFSSLLSPSKTEITDFVVGKAIGKGKFGNVYVATSKSNNIPVAVKAISKSLLRNELGGNLNILRNEVEVLQSLTHRNIVSLHG